MSDSKLCQYHSIIAMGKINTKRGKFKGESEGKMDRDGIFYQCFLFILKLCFHL